ncbi:MAG TPA: hypothetical protein VFY87_01595 [Geminicoccaceae bacterium]|nr:hypothetical protein [Geminicoccaceae bacterium]
MIPAYALAWRPSQSRLSSEVASNGKKLVHGESRLPEYGSERPFGQVARVIRDGRVAAGGRVVPDLVAAGSLPVEAEAQLPQTPRDVAVPEAGKTLH